MVHVARASARTLLDVIAIQYDSVPIVDQNDSVGFFQMHTMYLNHVLGRHVHTRPLLSDALIVVQSPFFSTVLVDSIAYPLDDHHPKINKNHLKCIKWPILRTSVRKSNDSQQSERHHPAHSILEDNGGRIHGNLNDTVVNENNYDPINYAVFKDAQKL